MTYHLRLPTFRLHPDLVGVEPAAHGLEDVHFGREKRVALEETLQRFLDKNKFQKQDVASPFRFSAEMTTHHRQLKEGLVL